MKIRKPILIGLASLFGMAFAFWGLLWIQLFACYPGEQVHATSVSPDGTKTARFSVKWEGIHRMLPYDIEPQYYVTVVENTNSWILTRESEFHGNLKASFSELAKKHAPWAVAELSK